MTSIIIIIIISTGNDSLLSAWALTRPVYGCQDRTREETHIDWPGPKTVPFVSVASSRLSKFAPEIESQ